MHSTTFQPVVQSPALPHAPYIYTLCLQNTTLFAIASDDVLRSFDPLSLRIAHEVKGVHESVTCLKGWNEDGGGSGGVVTAGRDGKVRVWDARTPGQAVMEMGTAQSTPLSALACNPSQHLIAAGVEVEVSGHEAPIHIWDARQTPSPLITYTESHTDTVATLSFLTPAAITTTITPSPSSLLLSGSTDSLLTLFDPTVVDEDDAVLRVWNVESAVHRAGCLSQRAGARAESGEWVWATSADEGMRVFDLSAVLKGDEGGDEEGKGMQDLGDVRELVGCRYVVDVVEVGGEEGGQGVAVGDAMRSHLAIHPLQYTDGVWSIRNERPSLFEGAHSEEIVRDFCLQSGRGSNGLYYTCGEDGLIRAWRPKNGMSDDTVSSAADMMDIDDRAESRKAKRRKK
ncbi:MAG: hypothetical protein M1822_009771 [Bathelium mastoideum]|nr:MAG: hypothetical protein M1822_009771 [Bathelium mastoideum]